VPVEPEVQKSVITHLSGAQSETGSRQLFPQAVPAPAADVKPAHRAAQPAAAQRRPDADGHRAVIGIWVQASEGAKFWAGVCAELANRGVRDILIACCDGLTGLPETIEATFPATTVQTSSVEVGAGGVVPLVTCAAPGRTYADATFEVPSGSTTTSTGWLSLIA
jgi:hypothetical protein